MKMKKFWALALALVLTMGLSVPALATDQEVTGSGRATITVTALLNLPTIKVTISPISEVVLNPYGLKVKVNNTINGDVDSGATLISTMGTIKSNSQVKMQITATPTIVLNGAEVAIKQETPSTEQTEKWMFAQLRIGTLASSTATSITDPEVAIAVKDGDAGTVSASVTLDAADDDQDSNAKWGGYEIFGGSGGTSWTGEENISIKLVFDISPVVTTGT